MNKKYFGLLIVLLVCITLALAFYIYKNDQKTEIPSTFTPKVPEVINAETSESTVIPAVKTEVVLDGLNNPWDIGFIDENSFIFTLKSGEVKLFRNAESITLGSISDVVDRGEGGLTALGIDSNFSENNYVYFCFNSSQDADIKVARFELDLNSVSLNNRKDIVTGIPANPSGRHSGCQLESAKDGILWVGTGDAAETSHPQDPQSLGGKILRVDRDGNAAVGNLGGEFDSRIFNYGHRNIQGISLFPDNEFGLVGVSAEHGSDRDDEINPLIEGNFGWDPNPGYAENVPMTDFVKFPNAIKSIWSSGDPTIATSGVTLIKGDQWLAFNNAIAFANLKGSKVVVLKIDSNLNILSETELFKNEFGRIRTIQLGLDGNLYLLTSNGKDSDKIIKVSSSN